MASPERQSLQKFSPGIPRPSGVCLLQAGHPPPESGGLAHSPAGDDCIALPVASDAFCPESHRFPLVVATTTENHLHYDTTQNSHSAGCDPHSRNDLPELPDITCLVPRPWSATLPEPHSTWPTLLHLSWTTLRLVLFLGMLLTWFRTTFWRSRNHKGGRSKSLHGDPRFDALDAHAKERATADANR